MHLNRLSIYYFIIKKIVSQIPQERDLSDCILSELINQELYLSIID